MNSHNPVLQTGAYPFDHRDKRHTAVIPLLLLSPAQDSTLIMERVIVAMAVWQAQERPTEIESVYLRWQRSTLPDCVMAAKEGLLIMYYRGACSQVFTNYFLGFIRGTRRVL